MRRALPVVGAVAVVLVGGLGVTHADGLRHQGWTGTPDRITACGRDYARGGSVVPLASVVTQGAVRVDSAPVRLGQVPVWGTHPAVGEAACGVAVWAELDKGFATPYTLLGSP